MPQVVGIQLQKRLRHGRIEAHRLWDNLRKTDATSSAVTAAKQVGPWLVLRHCHFGHGIAPSLNLLWKKLWKAGASMKPRSELSDRFQACLLQCYCR